MSRKINHLNHDEDANFFKFFRRTRQRIIGYVFKLCLVVIVTFILVIFRTRPSNPPPLSTIMSDTSTSIKPTSFSLNAPNIIFYKTQKTGSSSIQNIMYRSYLSSKFEILYSFIGFCTVSGAAQWRTELPLFFHCSNYLSTIARDHDKYGTD